MRYVVTGGRGFIGRHLVAYLEDQGHAVSVLDRPSHNVMDFQTVAQAIAGADGVFHLAAIVGFSQVMDDPFLTVDTELRGIRAVLGAVRLYGTPLVYTSSSAVYGRGLAVPPPLSTGAGEADDCVLGPTSTPSWGYAYAKAAGECLALAMARQEQHPIRVARLFNVAGAWQSGGAGFVLPRFCRQALLGAPLTVYAPGTQTRTFGHVADVVQGLADLMVCRDAIGEVVNLGGTQTVTMHELAQRVKEMAESPSPIELVPAPYGPGYDNVIDRKPDLTKARRLLNYDPQRTLEDMIRDVLLEHTQEAAA